MLTNLLHAAMKMINFKPCLCEGRFLTHNFLSADFLKKILGEKHNLKDGSLPLQYMLGNMYYTLYIFLTRSLNNIEEKKFNSH